MKEVEDFYKWRTDSDDLLAQETDSTQALGAVSRQIAEELKNAWGDERIPGPVEIPAGTPLFFPPDSHEAYVSTTPIELTNISVNVREGICFGKYSQDPQSVVGLPAHVLSRLPREQFSK